MQYFTSQTQHLNIKLHTGLQGSHSQKIKLNHKQTTFSVFACPVEPQISEESKYILKVKHKPLLHAQG